MEPLYDYSKLAHYQKQHFERLKRYIESLPRQLVCQDCAGAGGYKEAVLDDGSGPWFECGWCEGLGVITPHRRGLWLRMKKQEKRYGLYAL